MCKVMEDFKTETELRDRYRSAVRLIKMGLLPFDKIAEGIDLPLETVEKLAQKYAGKSE